MVEAGGLRIEEDEQSFSTPYRISFSESVGIFF